MRQHSNVVQTKRRAIQVTLSKNLKTLGPPAPVENHLISLPLQDSNLE